MVTRTRLAFALGVAALPAMAGLAFVAAQRVSGGSGIDVQTGATLPRQSEDTLLDLAARTLTCAEGERHVSRAAFDGDAHWEVVAQCLVDLPAGTHLTRDRFWWVSDADLSIDSAATSERKPPASCGYPGTSCIGESGPGPQFRLDLTVTPGSPRTTIR